MALHYGTVHRFVRLETSDKYKEVTHYEKESQNAQSPYILDFANISVQRNFNRSENVAFWYKPAPRKADGKRGTWAKNPITGLFRTSHPRIYYGDVSSQCDGRYRKHTFLFFVFNYDMSKMAIIEFQGFYPKDVARFISEKLPNVIKYFGL